MRLLLAAVLLSSLIVRSAVAQVPASERTNIADNPSWTAPQDPVRVYGNTWSVGPRGLGVFLFIARTGAVLIDGGVPEAVPLIEANIRRLGINLRDIKWILNSHAHFDHAGGIAQLAHDAGAQVIGSAADAILLARGGHDDPHPGVVHFWERVARRKQGDANALIDSTGCIAYANDARESFEEQLSKQRAR